MRRDDLLKYLKENFGIKSEKELADALRNAGKLNIGSDFVTETRMFEPCLFDMELVFILALGFKNVRSIKVVSDHLSIKQYKETVENV